MEHASLNAKHKSQTTNRQIAKSIAIVVEGHMHIERVLFVTKLFLSFWENNTTGRLGPVCGRARF